MSFKKGIIKNLTFYLFALFLVSCDAPHDNPADPNSLKEEVVQIVGIVQTVSLPTAGIPAVSIYWKPGNILVKSDNSGNFSISNIKPIDGFLYFQKDGYTSDSIKIVWGDVKKATPQISLNKIPTLESLSVYSEVINLDVQNQTSDIKIEAKISDSDNDIDSVYVKNEELKITKGLGQVGKMYQATLTSTDLNVTDIESTVGYDFDVWVIDAFNRKYMVGSSRVLRIIKNGANVISPKTADSLNFPIMLNWDPYSPGFDFTYKVEIKNKLQSVFVKDNISPGQTTLKVDSMAIPSGDYFWVIWVIDKFSDNYQSQSGIFKIQ
jgi:hypothetical protein